MKRRLLSLFIFVASVATAHSQDLMVTNDGSVIKAYGVEVSGSAVYYRLNPAEDSAIQRIAKSQLLMIKGEDGKVTTFENGKESSRESAPTPTPTPAPTPAPAQVVAVVAAPQIETPTVDRALNDQIIASINREVKYSGERGGSDENLRYFFQYFADEGSVFEDSNIKVTLSTTNVKTPRFAFWVTNKSSEVIRIDLSNSYYSIGNNSAVMRANQGTTVVSSASTKGMSVNLGGVARAAGVGGVVGGLANAVNVGGSNTQSTSKLIEDESYIVVLPPQTSKFLTDWGVVEQITSVSYRDGFKRHLGNGVYTDLNAGRWDGYISEIGDEALIGKQREEHLRISSYITYYKGENPQNANTVKFSLYPHKVMGINNSTKDLSPQWERSLFYAVKPIYPPRTQGSTTIAFYAAYRMPLGADMRNNNYEGIMSYGVSLERIYNRYKHRYEDGAFQYGFGVSAGFTNAQYSHGYDYYSDVEQLNLRLNAVIGYNWRWMTISLRPNIGFDNETAVAADDYSANDRYAWEKSGFAAGLDLSYDFLIKKHIFLRVNYLDLDFIGIKSWMLCGSMALGVQF